MSFSGDDYTEEEFKLATKLLGKKPGFLWVDFRLNDDLMPILILSANLSSKHGYNDIVIRDKQYAYIDNKWVELE